MKTYYSGTFRNNKHDIGNWVLKLASDNPGMKTLMAGPNAGKGSDINWGVQYDNSIGENIVARVTPKGVLITSLGDGDEYPFHKAAAQSGMLKQDASKFAEQVKRRQVAV